MLQSLEQSSVGSDDSVNRHAEEIPRAERLGKATECAMVQSISDTRVRVVLRQFVPP